MMTMQLPERVYCADVVCNKLYIDTSNKFFFFSHIYSLSLLAFYVLLSHSQQTGNVCFNFMKDAFLPFLLQFRCSFAQNVFTMHK